MNDFDQKQIDAIFLEATQVVRTLKAKPDNETLLSLYKYFKQATIGDINIEKPWPWQVEASAKYDAWLSTKGMTKMEAEKAYIELVKKLFDQEQK